MKNKSTSSQELNEQDDVFIGRRGYAIDFFDDNPEELIRYAKTRGMLSKEDADALVSALQESTREIFHLSLNPESNEAWLKGAELLNKLK